MQRVTRDLRVPASIGNVGPGFDTLGLAVALYLTIRVRQIADDGRGRLVCRFINGAPSGQNRIEQAFHALAPKRARRPSVAVEVRSDIPQRAGLGSSAAATIAGLRLRELSDGRRSSQDLVRVACELEGHPDNAAAAFFGGLTSSCVTDTGDVRVARWNWPRAWRVVVATPDMPLSTSASRRVLPKRIPLEDAVFNLQRVALLLAAVRDRDPDALSEALRDRCHQPYRQALVPQLRRALDLQHPDLLGVCLGGAGPSVVAIARRHAPDVARAVGALYRRGRVPCTVRTLTVHQGNNE
jgi:homoserine kinase